jgi:hypothetical protein
MTNTQIFLAYWIFSIVYESISFYFGYKDFKKKISNNPRTKEFIDALMRHEQVKNFKRMIWNPYVITVAIIIVSPFMLPVTIYGYFPSKQKRKAKEERIAMEEAHKRHEEFMKNEGEMCCPNEDVVRKEKEPVVIDLEESAKQIENYNSMIGKLCNGMIQMKKDLADKIKLDFDLISKISSVDSKFVTEQEVYSLEEYCEKVNKRNLQNTESISFSEIEEMLVYMDHTDERELSDSEMISYKMIELTAKIFQVYMEGSTIQKELYLRIAQENYKNLGGK